MKDKHRYIMVEASVPLIGDEKEFFYALTKEISRCVGEANLHKVNPKLMKFTDSQHMVIKSSLQGVHDLILSLALIKRVNGNEMAFYTLKSSGTIKALEKAKATAKE
jgi:RNase P/RNase MRP subunit POP5